MILLPLLFFSQFIKSMLLLTNSATHSLYLKNIYIYIYIIFYLKD
jgi:hypothetical protein